MLIGITGKSGSGKSTAANALVERFNFVAVGFADLMKRICKEVFDFSDEQLWAESEKRNEEDKRYFRGRQIAQDRIVCAECKEEYVVTRGNSARCLKCGYDAWKSRQYGVFGDVFLTPRYALQQLGSGWGRDCYPDIWMDHALRTAKKLLTGQYSYHPRDGLRLIDFDDQKTRTPVAGVVFPDLRFENEADAIRKAGGKIWRIVRPDFVPEESVSKHISETAQDVIEADLVIDGCPDVATLSSAVCEAYLKTRGTFPDPLPDRGRRDKQTCVLSEDGFARALFFCTEVQVVEDAKIRSVDANPQEAVSSKR